MTKKFRRARSNIKKFKKYNNQNKINGLVRHNRWTSKYG